MAREKFSDAEILEMWPQALGELHGFQSALQKKAGITASQIGMALQLATVAFEQIQQRIDQILMIDCNASKTFINNLKQSRGLSIEDGAKLKHHVESCEACNALCRMPEGNWSCNTPTCNHPTFKAAMFCMVSPTLGRRRGGPAE